MKSYYLEKPEKLVEIALNRASKKAAGIKEKKRKREKKAAFFSNCLIKKLETAVSHIPREKQLDEFSLALLYTMHSERELKQMRPHFLTVKKLLVKRKRAAIKAIWNSEKKEVLGELIGRSKSIMKSLNKTIKEFNSLQRSLRELPRIDSNAKTIILAGYPNVGKTTILHRLTGSKPEIASYPFTTKKLNLGFFEWKHRKIQVIDTPGLLERPLEKRNKIEKKAILALNYLADLVGFVVDCSEEISKLEEQKKLFESIKSGFKANFLVLFNKIDLAKKKQVKKAKRLFSEGEAIEFPSKESQRVKRSVAKKVLA